MKAIQCIFLFFISIVVYSQQDTLSTKNYDEIATIIRNYAATDSTIALDASRYFLAKATKEKNRVNQWLGIEALMGVYGQHKEIIKTERYSNELLAFTKKHSLDSLQFRAFLNIGVHHMRPEKLKYALHMFQEANKIAQKDNNLEQIEQSTYLISLVRAMGGDELGAIEAQQTMLRNLSNMDTIELPLRKKEELYFLAYSSIADSYIKAKKADSAYVYAERALTKGLDTQDSCIVKVLYWQLGQAEILKEQFDKAKISIEKSSGYCLTTSKIDSLMVGSLKGKIYFGKRLYKQAIASLEQGINAYDVSENEEGFMDDLYFILASAYKEDGNIEKAGYYLEKHVNTRTAYDKIKDTITNTFRAQEIATFMKELQLLKAQKNQKQNSFNYLLLGGSIIILGLLFILLKFYRNKKENEQKFQELLTKINAATKPQDIINTKDEELEEKNTTDVSEEIKTQILEGLSKLETKEYYLKQECNSYNVAKKIGTNTSYLSKVINTHYGKNFNTYINDLRINYAIIRLKNDVFFRSYSIQSIAEEVGYKSADSFTKYFKKDTGLNPSFYIKNIKNIA